MTSDSVPFKFITSSASFHFRTVQYIFMSIPVVSLKLMSPSEHVWSNHLEVDSGGEVSPRRGPWICRWFSLHPAMCHWYSGNDDVVACGRINISGRNDWLCDRGCGDVWPPCDSLLRYHSSFSTGCLEGGPIWQKSRTYGGRLLRYTPSSFLCLWAIWSLQLIRLVLCALLVS